MDLAHRIALDHTRVECGDCGKYFYIVTFPLASCGVWDSWRTLPCWQGLSHCDWLSLAQLTSAPSPSLSSKSSWISVPGRSSLGTGSTPALLSLGTHLISGLLLTTPRVLGNGESSC